MLYKNLLNVFIAIAISFYCGVLKTHDEQGALFYVDNEEVHDLGVVRHPRKRLTIMIYMAADNNLGKFAIKNLEQMMRVGSTDQVNIVVQLDIKLQGNKKITCRYYIKRDNVDYLNANESATQKMDSGNPETLVSFCLYAAHAFPADEYGLILWNHGTGIIDPGNSRVIDTTNLFVFNPTTHKLDIDRTVPFLDLLETPCLSPLLNDQDAVEQTLKKLELVDALDVTQEDENRGICWDDTTGNYLNNQGLEFALNHICSEIIHKKFAFIGFDACLMSMVEILDIVQDILLICSKS
jgi:hypothetical protein